MKNMNYLKYATIGIILSLSAFREPSVRTVVYKNVSLIFPYTIGEVVKNNNLEYLPKSYSFSKKLADSTLFRIRFTFEEKDFGGGTKPADFFYPRRLTAYMFDSSDTTGRFEAELKNIEKSICPKMTVTDMKAYRSDQLPDSIRNNMPRKGMFRIAEGWTKDSIHVYLREVPRYTKNHAKVLQTIFFSDIDLKHKEILIRAMN